MNQLKGELGNKCLECHKCREESHVKGHEVDQLTCKLNSLNLEMKPVAFDISKFKCEIARLNDIYLKQCSIFSELENKLNCLLPQLPVKKMSIECLMKGIEMKSHELCQKHD
jgi:predicted nuclease with TOPRIM domain